MFDPTFKSEARQWCSTPTFRAQTEGWSPFSCIKVHQKGLCSSCSPLIGLTHVHSQQHTYMSSSYRYNSLGLSHWDPYSCLELYYCNMVEWSGGIQAWSPLLTGLIVPKMTYNVLRGTLSNQTTNQAVVYEVSIDLWINLWTTAPSTKTLKLAKIWHVKRYTIS